MRPVARQRTLRHWAAAMEQQPRVWLPQELPREGALAAALAATVPVGVLLWFAAASLSNDRWPQTAVWGLFIGGVMAACVVAYLRHQKRLAVCGWEADFTNRRLEPVGQPGKQPIELGLEFSVGCYSDGAERGVRASYQLELRHARKGPVEVLTLVRIRNGCAEDLQVLEQCVHLLSQRLGIRRSGAPLVVPSRSVRDGFP